ncbi:MAG: SH3 domain-containing protein [Chloroflexi bacterium]|nr:SH3 domain-containing protein [Chloroflexota bacterium]
MKRLLYVLLSTSLLVSSCNLPAKTDTPEAVFTAAALTVEAAINPSNQTPLASPIASTGSNEDTSLQTSTPDSASTPLASFEDVTNCRTGPGVNYDRITQIQPGLAVKIVGVYPPNYWIVETNAGLCWVAGEFVTPSGNIAAVPTVTAPPTATGEPLQNVSLQKWDIFCNFATNEAEVTIRWADKEGESGYRVIRNDILVAELPPDTTEFKEIINLASGQSVGYFIIAYNALGQVQSKAISLSC